MNALTQQEARVSNAIVEGTICLARNIARLLFFWCYTFLYFFVICNKI